MSLIQIERSRNIDASWHSRTDIEKEQLQRDNDNNQLYPNQINIEAKDNEVDTQGVDGAVEGAVEGGVEGGVEGTGEEEWLRSVDRSLMTRASITCTSFGNGIVNDYDATSSLCIQEEERLAQLDSYLYDLASLHTDLILAVSRMELSQGSIESDSTKEHQEKLSRMRASKSGHGK